MEVLFYSAGRAGGAVLTAAEDADSGAGRSR